ncbi:MAG: C69 family dipeptidase [Prevotella sp.]|nr:C69 family dipeptidase [Prevotellaceae bacterium]MDY3366032.1 C69 family dipeptidase [Prevotella sp.]MDY3852265.1 C69 family dipeptidase [Prevotella sp.]
MKKHLLLLILAVLSIRGYACTNFIVGKAASADGSVFCSYNADDYGLFIGLCHFPAAKHAPGTMRKIYDWDSQKYLGEIPEAPETYNVIGNINEYQVSIGETTYGGREEMVDSTGLIDYGSLIYLALQRSKTAREAIKVMTSLTETYGYYSSGETFTICDPNEAWIMEMMGKGPGSKGVVWVAVRIPDNAICAHANQSRITTFSQYKKGDVMYSKDVIKFAREKGWYNGKDKDFSWRDTYAAADFGGRRFCDARVWAFFNHFDKNFDKYLPWVLGKDPKAEDMPLWIIPNKKVSLQDMQMCMRDHYENTPLAMDSTDIGGGIWQMPYRPTPLSYKVDGKKFFNERATSTQQTAFTYIAQLRSWLPREIGGILWFGNDDGNMVPYTPIYCGNTTQPECYNTPGADAVTFSDKNAFWVCNWVSNMVYPRYSQMFPTLKEVRDSLENSYFANQKIIEQQALAMYQSSPSKAVALLNNYSNEQAQNMLAAWKDLAIHLIVKYNDMAVKPTEGRKFLRTKEGLGARVKRTGIPTSFARQLNKLCGDKFEQPTEQ